MSFLRRLLGGPSDTAGGSGDIIGRDEEGLLVAGEATFDLHAARHRVTVWLRLLDPSFESPREQQRVFALENAVMRALDAAAAGEHDTNSLERGFLAVRLVGDDADAIVTVVAPLLVDTPPGSYLAVRRGPAGTAEDRLEVGDGSEASGAEA